MARKLGRKYHKKRVGENYDTIVIGSGIGGLCTAALLSKKGQKVCVLEQHYTAGGFTHTYVRNGYEWDVGVHYIGDVQKKWSPIRRVFDEISNNQLEWEFMGDVYDKIVIEDREYDFQAGRSAFTSMLKDKFPREAAAIDEYMQMVNKVNASVPKFFAGHMLPPMLSKVYLKARPFVLPDYANKNTLEVLQGLTQDKELIAVLTGQWGDHGHPPAESSFLMHCLIVKHYLGGGNYPVGGSSEIAATILPVIRETGGEVFTYAEVDKIIVENNEAKGVKLANGDEILANNVVSAAGITITVDRLLPKSIQQKYKLPEKLKATPPSSGHLCLYVGLKGSSKDLELPKHNYWLYPNGNDHDKTVKDYVANPDGEFPVVYISFPSAKDPAWDERFPDKSTIEIVTLSQYEWFEKWRDETWSKRGEEYEEMKEKLSQRLLAHLYKQLPHLEGKIDYYELSTPLSTETFQLNRRGEIYGVVGTPERFEQNWLHPKSPVKNLYLTGQDIMTAGVGGALLSGVMTTANMLPKKEGLQLMQNVFMGGTDKETGSIIPQPAKA